MSELRQDPTNLEWVIMAPERADGPQSCVRLEPKPELPALDPDCPFCPGNEALTPPEILSLKSDGQRGWKVRVFANKNPALSMDTPVSRSPEESFFSTMEGRGANEIIVESPLHNMPLALLESSQLEDILRVYQQRYRALSQTGFIRYVVIFGNRGERSGTALAHPHAQVIGTPVVPRYVRRQDEIAIRYFDGHGRSFFLDLIQHELSEGRRVVLESNHFVVFEPFASHVAFETWIIPKENQPSFGAVSEADLDDFAHVLQTTLLKLYWGLKDPDFSYIIYSSVVGEESTNYFIWHMRIIPRLRFISGFEIGSRMNINFVLPEDAAQFLRDVRVE